MNEKSSDRCQVNTSEKAISSYKATAGAGTDAFHPKVLLDFRDGTRQRVADLLQVVEVIGRACAKNSGQLQAKSTVGSANRVVGVGQSIKHGRL